MRKHGSKNSAPTSCYIQSCPNTGMYVFEHNINLFLGKILLMLTAIPLKKLLSNDCSKSTIVLFNRISCYDRWVLYLYCPIQKSLAICSFWFFYSTHICLVATTLKSLGLEHLFQSGHWLSLQSQECQD